MPALPTYLPTRKLRGYGYIFANIDDRAAQLLDEAFSNGDG